MSVVEDIWIKEVHIVNFQSIKKLHLKFVLGLNALVGESDSGKSAALRAIYWCLFNKPSGDHFITVGEKEAMVKVYLSNGKAIERKKSLSGLNVYRVYHDNDLVGDYTGFGSSVPEEVTEAHGMRPVADDVYFQFSHQLEGAFLLALSPYKRAEVLGNMDELKRIDGALTEVTGDIKSNREKLKELNVSKKLVGNQLKTLKYEIERAHQSIETLKVLRVGLEKKFSMKDYLFNQINRLKEVDHLLKEAQADRKKSAWVLEQWPNDYEEKVNRYNVLVKEMKRLREIKTELDNIELMNEKDYEALQVITSQVDEKFAVYQQLNHSVRRLKEVDKKLKAAQEGLRPEILSIDLEPLEKQLGKYKLLFGHLERLREIDQKREEAKKRSEKAKEMIDVTLDDMVNTIRGAGICPTCGQSTHDVCEIPIEEVN